MARNTIDSVLWFSLVLAIAETPSAQAPLRGEVASVTAIARGLWPADSGGFRAGGTAYEAAIDGEGLRLTPALGARAARDFALRYTLDSIRRGPVRIDEGSRAREWRRTGEHALARARGPGIDERFDVRAEGVEVSYRFERRLPGHGPLVVRARLDTELTPDRTGESAGGLRFTHTAGGVTLGGVSIGAVTGIDALGRTVRGTARLDGGHVEFELPAEFVAAAAYPLVLDPLIGPELAIGPGTGDRAGDVAYSAANDTYCFVWTIVFSLGNAGVRAQRMSGTRSLIGSMISVTASTGDRLNPVIGSASGRFLAVWQERASRTGPYDIRARTVGADGTLSAGTIAVAATVANETEPDVSCGVNSTLVVWNDQSGIGIAEVTVPAGSADPRLAAPARILASDATASRPVISKGYRAGRHCVVFQRVFNGTTPGMAMVGVRPDGTALHAIGYFHPSVGQDERDPEIDGDGDRFALVYARKQSGSSTYDIWCRPLRYDKTFGVIGPAAPPIAVAATPDVDETTPAVGFAKIKFVVAWVRAKAGVQETELRVVGLRPSSGTACDKEATIPGVHPHNTSPAIAAKFAVGGSDDTGIIAFLSSTNVPPITGQLRAQRFEAALGGSVTNVGGGCGDSGTFAVLGDPAIGNPEFSVRLSNTSSAHTAILNLGLPGKPIPCGTCQILPGFISVSVPIASGAFDVPIPIPCDPGLDNVALELQWMTVGAPVRPCPALALMGGASDRVQITIRF